MSDLFKDKIITTEIEAYLLGFIFADGFITSKKRRKYYAFGITLSIKDKDFLIRLNDFLKGKIKEKTYKCQTGLYKSICLTKHDVKFIDRLMDLNIKPKKTIRKETPIPFIEKSVIHHFIRGFFDGDGTICRTSEGKYVCGFVGTNLELFNFLSDFFKKKIKIEKNKYFRLLFSGNPSCKNVSNLIYKDATIFLKRKKDLFDEINITHGKNGQIGLHKRKNGKWTIEIDGQYRGIFKTKEEALIQLNNIKHEQ